VPKGHWFGVSVALFSLWMLVTWRLEGRRRTLHHVDDRIARFRYTLSANVLVGIIGSAGLLLWMRAFDFVTLEEIGFQSPEHALLYAAVGLAGGILLLLLKRLPTASPTVLLNVFCQVLPVSIAEVLICWSVAGGMIQSVIGAGTRIASVAAFLGSAVAFGVYHFAHSPPFNTRRMVGSLILAGLVTGVFFHATHDIHGTIAFHNAFAMLGVITATEKKGNLANLQNPRPDLVATAVLAVFVLSAVHAVLYGGAA